MRTKKSINQLAYKIIGCAIEVHRHLGPGLLESIYEDCLYDEMVSQDLEVSRQIAVPVIYKNKKLSVPLKLDLLVEDTIILELKALEFILPVHKAQLLSYMKLTNRPKGILINFHTDNITKNAVHLVNEIFAKLPD